MFGWLKSAKRHENKHADANAGEPIIAALLLQGDSFPLASVHQQLGKTKLCGQRPTEAKIEKGILSFGLGDEIVAVAQMPAPYPWSDLEGPCATSWMWPNGTAATEVIRPHRTHVLVTMIGGQADRIPRRMALTALTALAARQPGVLGVYWPEATLVHFPKLFIEMAETITSPKAPPVLLWVDFRIFKNEGGTCGMFTTGLSAIGHMEFEIPSVPMEPAELRDWCMNITYYLIENGPVLKNGDTIGATEEAMFRIRHVPSSYGHEGQVMRFAIE